MYFASDVILKAHRAWHSFELEPQDQDHEGDAPDPDENADFLLHSAQDQGHVDYEGGGAVGDQVDFLLSTAINVAGISDMGLDEIDADQQCDPLPKDPPTDYEKLREFANEEVIDWVGLQVPGTEVLMSHHPGTRTSPGVIRTAQGRYTNTRGASQQMSCKRLMTNSVQLRQKEEVEKKVQEVSVSESTPKRPKIAAINWR